MKRNHDHRQLPPIRRRWRAAVTITVLLAHHRRGLRLGLCRTKWKNTIHFPGWDPLPPAGANDCGGGQIFVHSGNKGDVVGIEIFFGGP